MPMPPPATVTTIGKASPATRNDVQTGSNDGWHWVWGYDGNLGSNPDTFYLY